MDGKYRRGDQFWLISGYEMACRVGGDVYGVEAISPVPLALAPPGVGLLDGERLPRPRHDVGR
jgi:hypothetical protein